MLWNAIDDLTNWGYVNLDFSHLFVIMHQGKLKIKNILSLIQCSEGTTLEKHVFII